VGEENEGSVCDELQHGVDKDGSLDLDVTLTENFVRRVKVVVVVDP